MQLIDTKEAQATTGCSRSTLNRARKHGLRAYKIGRAVRYDLDDVKDWITQHKEG